jgi:hypothetical protein
MQMRVLNPDLSQKSGDVVTNVSATLGKLTNRIRSSDACEP